MKAYSKKSYIVPEVAMLPLVPMGAVLGSSQFGHNDGEPGSFTAPRKDIYID